jgi:hypothetical protein
VTGAPYSLSGTYLSGQFPRTIYAIRMKASARYLIHELLALEAQLRDAALGAVI